MPLYDLKCRSCGSKQERYLSQSWHQDPECEVCGGATDRLMSRFAVCFTGVMSASKYKDRSLEGGHSDGQWVTSLRTPDGKPKQEFLHTFQDQKEWCRREGVVNPKDLPSNAEAVSDRKLSEKGMPGQWI